MASKANYHLVLIYQQTSNSYCNLSPYVIFFDGHTLIGLFLKYQLTTVSVYLSSKVIILDEPTKGMDPAIKSQIWSLLKSSSKDHVILLTTHYMDEANALADRIAIMDNGKLKCSGTPSYLKSVYGKFFFPIFILHLFSPLQYLIAILLGTY